MSLTVWKFPLVFSGRQKISMPSEAEFLSAQYQGKELCIWAAVDPDSVAMDQEILIHGTGHELGWYSKHLATVQDGSFVWHVFAGEGPLA